MSYAGLTRKAENGAIVRPKMSRDDLQMRIVMGVIGVFLLIGVLLPLYTMMSKSVEDKDGAFVGLANFAEYFSTPALFNSAFNSLSLSVMTTFSGVPTGRPPVVASTAAAIQKDSPR